MSRKNKQNLNLLKPVQLTFKTFDQALASKSLNPVEQLYYGVAEQTYATSPYHPASQDKPYNPDDLYQKYTDYSIYEDMLNDDQVSICSKLSKDMVLGSGWDIITKEDDELHHEIKEFLELALTEKLKTPLEEQLEQVLSAYDFGFSLTEKIFEKQADGYLCLKELKTRHPSTWMIHTDDKGNVEKYVQHASIGDLVIEPTSLIHYINNPLWQNPYGKSDLRAAFNAWFIKRQVVKYLAIYLEKAASPIPIARYKPNAPQQAVTDLHNAIKSFQTKTALTIPEEIQVEFLEAKNSGDVYHKAINLFNMFIGRSMFIPDLLGFQGSETSGGSFALGKDQIDVYFKHIKRRRETLERLVNTEIIKPLITYNFGFVENHPKWKLREIKDDQAIELAKVWLEAVKSRVYAPSDEEINHFRKLCKFPESNGDEEIEITSQPETGQETKDIEEKTPIEKYSHKQFKQKLDSELQDFSKKVDFKMIETSMDSYENALIAESEPIIREIYKDLANQIEKKRIIQLQKPDKIEALKIKFTPKLKQIIKAYFRDAYEEAQIIGEKELLKSNYRKPVADERFMDFIESEAELYFTDFSNNALKKTKVKLLDAITNGRVMSEVLDQLEEEGLADSITSLKRYARTKFTQIMNRGRQAFFNTTDVVSGYTYSAIIDRDTTDICRSLDGKKFEKGSEPTPPLHFNCRSLLVPLTKYESWEPDTKIGKQDIQDFIKNNKGEGF